MDWFLQWLDHHAKWEMNIASTDVQMLAWLHYSGVRKLEFNNYKSWTFQSFVKLISQFPLSLSADFTFHQNHLNIFLTKILFWSHSGIDYFMSEPTILPKIFQWSLWLSASFLLIFSSFFYFSQPCQAQLFFSRSSSICIICTKHMSFTYMKGTVSLYLIQDWLIDWLFLKSMETILPFQ